MSLPEKSAIVTGATGGIGGAIAAMLAGQGYQTTLVGRDLRRLELISGKLGSRTRVEAADISNAALIEKILAAHESAFGSLDVLVNAAGTLTVGAIDALTIAQIDEMLSINLRVPVLFYRAATPLLKKTALAGGQALVVNIASISGKRADANFSVYSASKFGLRGLSEAMNAELRSAKIATCTLFPGVVDTAMADWARGWMPPEKMLHPTDIANAVKQLLTLPFHDVPPEIDFKT